MFCMSYRLILFFFSCLSIAVISGSFEPDTHVSTNVKKRSIGWVNPDKMIHDDDDEPHLGFKSLDLIGSRPNSLKGGMGQKNIINSLHKYEGFIRRFINLFLRSSGLGGYKLKRGSVKQVHFDYIINHEELEVLQNFGEPGIGLDDVDAVLTKLFIPHEGTFFEHRSSTRDEYTIAWFANIFTGIFGKFIASASTEVLIFTSVTVVWLGTFWSTYISGSYRMPIINVIIFVFFSGFAFTWVRMLQEAEAEAFHAEMVESNTPPYCRGTLVPWYTSFYYFLVPPDCSQYFKSKLVSPIVKISPAVVLSETISQVFLHPALNIGKAYGDFIMGASGSVPWYLKIIIVPICFIIPIVFIFGVIVLCTGSKFSVSPWGFSLSPHWSKPAIIKGKRKEKYIDDKEKYVEDIVTEKDVNKNPSMFESVLSNVKKPFVIMNWRAFEKIKLRNKEKPSIETDAEIKSITSNGSLSDCSENSDRVTEMKGRKKRDICIGGSGDSFNTVNKQMKKENYSKQCRTRKRQAKEYVKTAEGSGDFTETSDEGKTKTKSQGNKYLSTVNEDCNLTRSDVPSTSKKKIEVQQWLDNNYTP